MAVVQLRGLSRPLPPAEMVESLDGRFEPAPYVTAWLRETLIDEGGVLTNEEHEHLRQAEIGVLWTTVINRRRERRIIGQAELGDPQQGSKWSRARAVQQIEDWFGDVPDFIITLDARYCAVCDDASFAALCEHELCHCSQERGEFGEPKFKRDGTPRFALRGHDVEQFVSVVARYGMEAAGVAALVEAARRGPTIAQARIEHACGTCVGRRAA